MSQKFKSDIETQAGLIDSFGFSGSAGQILSSTGTKTEWITPPQSPGGGGSSQVFYFNGGVASSVGGYYQMSPVANTSTAADFTINANGYIASFLTDVNSPNQLNIPAGNWNFEIYFSASSGGGSPSFYIELYKYSSSTFTLIASGSASPEGITNGTAIDAYFTPLAVPATTLLATDRLAVRVYVTHSGRIITMHTQNGHLSEVITTFSTGLTALNGLTEQVQYFATGAGGTDFNIASAVNTHTFNLPTASATNRGALSSADWITFNSKANASGTTNYISKFTGTTTLGNSQLFDNGTSVLIGTSTPPASGVKFLVYEPSTPTIVAYFQNNNATCYTGYQSSTTTLNAVRIGASGNNLLFSVSTDGSPSEKMRIDSLGNVGIGTSSPTRKLDVAGLSMFNGAQLRSTDDGSTLVGFVGNRSAWTGGSLDNNLSIAAYTSNICFFTNNSVGESMRITSTGNVGIGTTSPSSKLTVDAGDVTLTNGNLYVAIGSGNNYSSRLSTALNYPNVDTYLDSIGGGGWEGRLNFRTSSNGSSLTTKMTITDSGNVGIGTTSPGVRFVNSGGAFSSGPTLGSGVIGSQALLSNNGLYGMYSGVSSNGDVWQQVQRNDANATVYNLALQPSGGNIYIGTTAPIYGTSSKMQFLFNGLNEFGINFKSTAVNSIPIHFTSSTGTQTGYIFQDATSVFLVSVSDYRLKEDLNSFSGLDLISKINVYDYKWKNQDKRSFGVMAHELQEIVPQAAFGEKDGERMQGVDYSTLVPILIQAIKEQQTQIEELKILINK